jgi:hypothetical protein
MHALSVVNDDLVAGRYRRINIKLQVFQPRSKAGAGAVRLIAAVWCP